MTDEIGVLLPLQLETTFLPPDAGAPRWRLRLRVIPQPVSVDGHTDHVADEELRAVTAFRVALGRTDALTPDWFGTEDHRRAFGVLARAVGPARASWLVTTVSSAEVDGRIVALPPDSPDDHPARVRGLPARLRVGVWTYDADGAEVLHQVGSLPHDEGATIAGVLDLPDLSGPDELFYHWVANWERACELGLGGTFDLPDGIDPLTLGGVGVWGIGDHSPDVLIEHHVHAGALAEVVLGSATHSVDGRPTSTSTADAEGAPVPDGAPDVEAHWQALLRGLAGTPSSLDGLLERFLTGRPVAALARPVGRERLFADLDVPATLQELFAPDDVAALVDARSVLPAETGLAPLLLHALWPALWGSVAHDEWGLSPEVVGPLSRWALENVNPEGPLPTLRVGDEPYALLPLTRLDTWRPAADEDALAAAGLGTVVAGVQTLRRHLHATVRTGGTVAGGDVAHYADVLLRGGSSRVFGTRRSVSRPLVEGWLGIAGPWDRRAEQLAFLGLPDPVADPFVEVSGAPSALDLALVRPRHWTYWGWRDRTSRVPLPALVEMALGRGWTLRTPTGDLPLTLGRLFDPGDFRIDATGGVPDERPLGVAPDSLLVRLLLQSVLTANTWLAGPVGTGVVDALGPGFGGEGGALAALQLALLLDPGDDTYDWRKPGSWPTDPDGWTEFQTPQGPVRHPEYTASSCRPDVQRRLERALGAVLDTVSTRVDPWLTAVAWQRLRAASADPGTPRRLGAYGWVHGPFAGTPGPTESGLLHTPSQAQTLVATLVRDDFRENLRTGTGNGRGGVPSGIALTGAAVRFADAYVDDLRDGHHPYEIVGREVERIVTAGVPSPYEVAAALRRRFPPYPERPDPRQTCQGLQALAGLLADPAAVPGVTVSHAQVRELGELRAGLDAVGDLALLDGALHAASGRPALASAALRGASGSAAAAVPEYPRTPAPGRELRTTVLAVVPWREAPAGAGGAGLAEPSVAAFLASELGDAWTWGVRLEDGTSRSVTLGDLGLTPIDTLVFSPAQLRRFAAVAAGVGEAGVGEAEVSDPPEVERAARLCALLGTPATERDLAADDAETTPPAAYEELFRRYDAVHTDLEAAVADLGRASAPGAAQAVQVAAIRRAARWGVTPDTTPADAAALAAVVTGTPVPEGATGLAELADAMGKVLGERLAHAAAPGDVPSVAAHRAPLDERALREAGVPEGVAGLARSLSALVAPQGNLPILTRWTTAALADLVPLVPRPDTFEERWLTVVAPVRGALARVEAHQLDARARGAPGLAAWSSDADPWQTEAVASGAADPTTRTPFGYRLDPFVAAFGPAGAFAGQTLAVGVVDSYSEVVPLPRQDTHAAFGFNAPAARAPQAILLAVPPNAGEPLTDDDLAVMLAELRELVVARSARMPDLLELGGLLRTTWIPQDEPVSVLDPDAHLNAR